MAPMPANPPYPRCGSRNTRNGKPCRNRRGRCPIAAHKQPDRARPAHASAGPALGGSGGAGPGPLQAADPALFRDLQSRAVEATGLSAAEVAHDYHLHRTLCGFAALNPPGVLVADPADNQAAARRLNTVYITEWEARAAHRKGTLVVDSPTGRQRIPLEAVDSVILLAGQITVDAIAECARRNIRVAALTRNGKIRFTVNPPISGNVHLRAAHHKAAADPDTALRAARHIVAAKLVNQSTVLARWAKTHPDPGSANDLRVRADTVRQRVPRLAEAADRDAIRGIEGDAARIYFKGIALTLTETPGMDFAARTRRPPRDPVNAALSFGYGLAASEIAGACDAIGLDPQTGFLHQALRTGRPSLALDLLEELRPSPTGPSSQQSAANS